MAEIDRDSDPSIDEPKTGQVRSLLRALRLLDTVAARAEGMSLTELARATDLSAPTVHRLLTTLEEAHYVRFDPATRRWAVGVQAFLSGLAYADGMGLRRLADPPMRTLFGLCHETVNLAVEERGTILYLHQLGDPGASLPGSTPLPVHGSGAGKALLSAKTDPVLSRTLPALALTRLTVNTVPDLPSLRDQISRARRSGYAIDDEEHLSGVRCVASPILDRGGRPVAALSISAPCERMGDDRIGQIGMLVRQAAEKVTLQLGGRPH